MNKARELTSKAVVREQGEVPDFLVKLSYDDWRNIRFEPEHALWKGSKLAFQVQFFHPGLFYNRVVKIHEVTADGTRQVPFSREMFRYGREDTKERVPKDLGFSGFRVHYPLNRADYYDEVIVFLGASYLRAVGVNQNYGMSARGLAIDTALASGEEFPFFSEFWIVRPAPEAKELCIYALLDSAGVTGAYRYIVQPGKNTRVQVSSRIFQRERVKKLGIAPLTSMFFYGENTTQCDGRDFRPEVHDSDGLLVAADSEWIWRPLANPRSLLATSFETSGLGGFGLLQRDLDFDHYQDLEANHHTRPSVWVTPKGSWGSGRVELIQIPTTNEMNDNIIAFWVPEKLPDRKEEPLSFSYTMDWHFPGVQRPPGGRVTATRISNKPHEGLWQFVLDFSGGSLESLPADTPLAGAVTSDPRARLVEQQLYKNRVTGGWRLAFTIAVEKPGTVERAMPKTKSALELRAFLKKGDDVLTETWSYAFHR